MLQHRESQWRNKIINTGEKSIGRIEKKVGEGDAGCGGQGGGVLRGSSSEVLGTEAEKS